MVLQVEVHLELRKDSGSRLYLCGLLNSLVVVGVGRAVHALQGQRPWSVEHFGDH